jgi:hypothetical protein
MKMMKEYFAERGVWGKDSGNVQMYYGWTKFPAAKIWKIWKLSITLGAVISCKSHRVLTSLA